MEEMLLKAIQKETSRVSKRDLKSYITFLMDKYKGSKEAVSALYELNTALNKKQK